MGRILVCGLAPLPFENTSQNYGPGIRTWQLAAGLAAGGHAVRVVAMVIPQVYEEGELERASEHEGIAVLRLQGEEFFRPETIRRTIADFAPDALVGATIYGSLALVQSGSELPLWADQFGHVMAEAQAKAALEGANWPIPRWWRMVHPVMSRADKVSTVSERQRYAAIGELGALGRLAAETCGYEFTAVIPCGAGEVPPAGSRSALRGTRVPDDAFLVLWSGGFNVWSDVETLFAGLERAMGQDPRVHFVATGGAIAGHDAATYARLEARIAGSELASRFHLEGWVKRERVGAYIAEADLGVLTDRPIYEGLLGSKNRLVEWMLAGLPVLYNELGDLGELYARERLGLTFPVGDAEALAARILEAAGDPGRLLAMAERARAVATRDFSFAATTRDLRSWAAAPRRAPDAPGPALRSPLDHEQSADAASDGRAATVRHGGKVAPPWRRWLRWPQRGRRA
jgi:glycosyltransferase involved in cell wall biosynthesis